MVSAGDIEHKHMSETISKHSLEVGSIQSQVSNIKYWLIRLEKIKLHFILFSQEKGMVWV